MDWASSVLKKRGLPGYQMGRLAFESRIVDHLDDARKALEDFGGAGWICFASAVAEVTEGKVPQGTPLCAELFRETKGGTESMQLRQEGSGWRVVKWNRTDERPDGTDHRLVEHRLARIGGGELHYDVAWRRDDEGNWRPWAARLKNARATDPMEGPR